MYTSTSYQSNEGVCTAPAQNFRSRESILRFVNLVFESTMRRSLGGVEYDEARLAFGGANERQPFAAGADVVPSVELHLRLGTFAQRRAYVLADNKLAEKAGWAGLHHMTVVATSFSNVSRRC